MPGVRAHSTEPQGAPEIILPTGAEYVLSDVTRKGNLGSWSGFFFSYVGAEGVVNGTTAQTLQKNALTSFMSLLVLK